MSQAVQRRDKKSQACSKSSSNTVFPMGHSIYSVDQWSRARLNPLDYFYFYYILIMLYSRKMNMHLGNGFGKHTLFERIREELTFYVDVVGTRLGWNFVTSSFQ